MYKSSSLLLALLTAAVAGCGSPSYDLKGTWQQGEVVREEMTVSMTNGQIVYRVGAEHVIGKATFGGHATIETSVLATDGKGPTKLKVSHLVDESGMGIEIPGEELLQENEAGVLQGASILFTRTDSEWKKTLLGGPPSPAQARELEGYVNPLVEEMVPDRKVKVGESWTFDKRAMGRFLGSGFHDVSGSQTVNFDKVVEYEGESCALLSFEGQMTGTMYDDENNEIKVSMSLQGHAYRSVKTRLDVYTEVTGTMRLEGKTVVEGTAVQMTFSGPMIANLTQTQY